MKKFVTFASSLLLSISSAFLLLGGHVSAASIVWNGTAGDHKFSTAGNWQGGVAPTSGDGLIFPYGTGVTDKAPVDDMSAGTTFTSISFSGSPSLGEDDYIVTGNSVVLSGGIAVTAAGAEPTLTNNVGFSGDQTINTGNGQIVLGGVLSGSGNLTKTGAGILFLDSANTFTGNLTANAGEVVGNDPSALGATSAGTTINDGAEIAFSSCDPSLTIAEPLTLNGASSSPTGDYPLPKLSTSTNICAGGGGPDEAYGFTSSSSPVTLSGDITLGSDTTFGGFSPTELTGNLSGAFKINLVAGYPTSLKVNGATNSTHTANGTYTPATFTKTLSNSMPTNTVEIFPNNTITITGTRSDVTVNGGTLKGTGTVGVLDLISGMVAPGMSPGILTTGDLTFTGGTYQAQLGGTASGKFDQINAAGTVTLGTNTTLSTSLYNGFKPSAGNSFMIIKNDGSDAVSGHFKNLAEGATFKLSGYVFKITYKGGTGNDVVLSVLSVPNAPDTGFNLKTKSPDLAIILLSVVAPSLLLSARFAYAKKRIRH